MLQSLGLQRPGHDLATKQEQQIDSASDQFALWFTQYLLVLGI